MLVMTEDGVKKGAGVRRVGAQDRWSPDGWERLKGLPRAHDAERPVRPGESLIIEDGRLVVPPAAAGPIAAPAIQRRIRREEVFKPAIAFWTRSGSRFRTATAVGPG